jgi:LysR family nod box-dependent transcriptional activator
MNLKGLDLNLLVTLNVLLEERNITNAAKRLCLSQSGTSTALMRLREFFKDELLTTIGRRMVLTPLAQTMVDPVHAIVLQAQTLIDSTPGFKPETATRRFVVMASDYVATVFLSRVVERLARDAPGIVLEIIPFATVPLEPLERGETDLLIIPEHYLSREHPSSQLFTERYVCVCWKGNERIQDELDFDTYMNSGHVLARFGKDRGMAFDEWFLERYERPRRIEAIVMNFTMLPHFVVNTQRLSTMHARLAQTYAQFLPLRICPLPFEMPLITECMQWHRFSHRHPALIWLRSVILAVAAEAGGTAEAVAT